MILLPIGHERQTVQRLPWVTFTLIGICVLVYLYTSLFANTNDDQLIQRVNEFFTYYTEHPYLEIPAEMQQFLRSKDQELFSSMKEGVDRASLDPDKVREEQQKFNEMSLEIIDLRNANPLRKWGYVPNDPHFINAFTCLFLHEGFWHLAGNMLFLFLAGCAIEDLWGRPLFAIFYLLSGAAATITHDLRFSDSAVPIIGASGAIAGIMGAFLVRLARTRIKFFYLLFLFVTVKSGTFEAPAFIMLPLWFVQQILYAVISDESAGVAFWAHIGGFGFGALCAYVVGVLKIEEKYVAPAIEKKITLVQNPLFVKAIQLSEQGSQPEALVMLQRVVRKEPNNIDAFLEMRNIYERARDSQGYTMACAGLIDAALRSRDPEMVMGHIAQYRNAELQRPLPAKTLLGLGTFYEDSSDEHSAVKVYNELLQTHPDDPLAMKGASRLARVYFEKLSDREAGEAAFWAAYQHPLANQEWRNALNQDMKRYQVDPNSAPDPGADAPAAAQQSIKVDVQEANEEGAATAPAPPPVPSPPAPSQPTPAASPLLPSPDFDGTYSDWTIVACNVGKPGLKGLNLQNASQANAMLPWKRIRFVSAARIRTLSGGRPGARDSLLLDLVVAGPQNGLVVYRTTGKAIDFKRIFPGVEQTFFDAYENFLGILLANSGAKCVPDRERCTGPVFAEYSDLQSYEANLREELKKA